jgi:recombination protein RecA
MMTIENKAKDPYMAFFEAYAQAENQMEDITRGHEVLSSKVDVIPTGSLVLDDALSSGGIPCGRILQYYGPPGSGKTLMSMIAIIEAQKKSSTARQMFIDSEHTFDTTWAASIGVDLKRLIIIRGEMAVIGRQCFEMLLGVPKEDAKTHVYKGQAKEGLLDKIASKELDYNLIILDSLGSLIPVGEDTSIVGKQNISLLARFLTTTLRKTSLQVNKAKIPFIIINHKKANMDPYASDHTYSGGNTYSHFLSANIYFEPVNRAEARILDDKEQKIGQRIRATVEKSKFGPSPRKCEFDVMFDKGIINQEEEIATLAIDYGIVDHPTAPSYIYGDRKWVGKEKFSNALIEDKALADELVQKIGEARDKKHEAKLAEQEAVSEKLVEEAEKKVSKAKNKKKEN